MTSQDPRSQIQHSMRDAFPIADERVLRFYAMQHYQLGWRDEALRPANYDPGKLVRPRLALLACRAVGGNERQAEPVAAAIQLVHDFSLIHDDIEDNSDTRRGRPTVWSVWGLAQGINTGDGMLIVAHLALHRLADAGLDAALVLEVARRFDQAILTVCEGQFLDLSYEGNLTISEDDYLAMISRKTAALIAAAAGLGALVGGANHQTASAMERFGRNLGLAFQIQDDLLGVWGEPAVTGKPFAADLSRRKLSLPVIRALRTAARRDELAALYRTPIREGEDVRPLLDLIDSTDARDYTAQMAASYHQQALEALDSVQGDAAALAELRAIAVGLLGRKS